MSGAEKNRKCNEKKRMMEGGAIAKETLAQDIQKSFEKSEIWPCPMCPRQSPRTPNINWLDRNLEQRRNQPPRRMGQVKTTRRPQRVPPRPPVKPQATEAVTATSSGPFVVTPRAPRVGNTGGRPYRCNVETPEDP